jgi:hypothetical protein
VSYGDPLEKVDDKDELYRRLIPTSVKNGEVLSSAFYARGMVPDPEISVNIARLSKEVTWVGLHLLGPVAGSIAHKPVQQLNGVVADGASKSAACQHRALRFAVTPSEAASPTGHTRLR